MKLLSTVALAAALAAIPSLTSAQEVVRIATEGAYPPFNYMNENGEAAGFDVDVARAICDAEKWKCEIVVQDWDGIIPGLLAERYDAIVASMGITPQRANVVAFSDVYARVPYQFVMSDKLAETVDAAPGSGIEQLKKALEGKVVGLVAATSSEPYVQDKFGDSVAYRSYQKMDDALQDLVSGRINAYADGALPITENFLKKDAGKGFRLAGDPFIDPQYFGAGNGIAVRKDDAELLAGFNHGLAKILADKTYAAINDKYFSFNVYGQ